MAPIRHGNDLRGGPIRGGNASASGPRAAFRLDGRDIADQLLGIEFDPRVCGGSARIAGTRIPGWSLESWCRLGADDGEILRNYSTLQPSDLLDAWRYVERHPQEMDREIQENEADD